MHVKGTTAGFVMQAFLKTDCMPHMESENIKVCITAMIFLRKNIGLLSCFQPLVVQCETEAVYATLWLPVFLGST